MSTTKKPVVIKVYGYTSCAYYQKASAVARSIEKRPSNHVKVEVHEAPTRESYQFLLKNLQSELDQLDGSDKEKAKAHTTSPLVIINNTYIGGCDDMIALQKRTYPKNLGAQEYFDLGKALFSTLKNQEVTVARMLTGVNVAAAAAGSFLGGWPGLVAGAGGLFALSSYVFPVVAPGNLQLSLLKSFYDPAFWTRVLERVEQENEERVKGSLSLTGTRAPDFTLVRLADAKEFTLSSVLRATPAKFLVLNFGSCT